MGHIARITGPRNIDQGAFAPSGRGSGRIRLLDADPDLADRVDRSRRSSAVERLLVDTGILGLGNLTFETVGNDVAYLILSGTIARQTHLGSASSLEFLLAGHLLRPESDLSALIAPETSHEVLTPGWIAVLDSRFWRNVAAFPEVTVALFDRAMDRSRQLGVRLALSSAPDLVTKLRLLFQHLAGSHGRVTANGVLVDLKLNHNTIAHLIAANRSSVSTALKRLENAGELGRENGRYLLHRSGPLLPAATP